MWRRVKNNVVESSKQKKDLSISINADKAVIDSLKKETSSLQKELIKLNDKIAVSQKDSAIYDSECNDKKKELKKLSEEITKKESTLKEKENEIELLNSNISKLWEEYIKTSVKYEDDFEKIKSDKEFEIKTLSDKHSKTLNEVSIADNENNSLKANISTNTVKLEDITVLLGKKESEYTKITKSIESKEDSIKSIEETGDILSVALEEIKKDTVIEKNNLTNVKEELEKIQTELLTAKDELAKTKETNLSLTKKEARLNDLSSKVVELYKKAWITIKI